MGRKVKPPKIKEPVHIRKRKRRDGLTSLFLDIYQKGFRKYEHLDLYLLPGNTPTVRKRNAQIMATAERVKMDRIIQLQNYGTANWNVMKKASMTLEDWLTMYDHEDIPLSKSAFVNRQKAHKWMTRYLKKVLRPRITLEEIDKDFCRSFISFMRHARSSASHKKNDQDLHQSTIHGYVATISASLNKAVRDSIIPRNPFKLLEAREKVPKKDRERDFLTIDELRLVMDTPCVHESMKRAFIYACFTGLRISDVLTLSWNDISLSNTHVEFIHTQMHKTKEYVTVPLAKEAKKWMPERSGTTDLVFYDLPKSRNTRNKAITTWVAAAGIPKHITFHSARHTFATLLLTLGSDLYTTSKLLGHKNVTTTEIYAKIIDKKKIDTIHLIDEMFDPDDEDKENEGK